MATKEKFPFAGKTNSKPLTRGGISDNKKITRAAARRAKGSQPFSSKSKMSSGGKVKTCCGGGKV